MVLYWGTSENFNLNQSYVGKEISVEVGLQMVMDS